MVSKKKLRSSSPPRRSSSAISEAEIDLLKVFVRTSFGGTQQAKDIPPTLLLGNVRVDFVKLELSKDGKRLNATAREFLLLKYLLLHEGEVVSREQLLHDVWGFEQAPETRSVDNYILALRKKLEPDPSRPRYILTVRGVGYKFKR